MLASASVVGATSVGAVAFTEASVTRDVKVDIVKDDVGPIQLEAGATDAVTLDGTSGLLTIDTDTANADGLNGEGSFTYGDTSGASTTHAFSMTNKGGGSRDFTFGLKNFTPTGAVEMGIYDSGDVQQGGGNVTQTTDQTATGVAADSTLFVTISFDTNGLTKADNLNGDFTISAVTP